MAIRLTTEQFIERARKVHGDTYKYDLVNYTNSHTKVKIICKTHGVFKQTPNDHLCNRGCGLCRGDRISMTKRDTKNNFIKKAKLVHGDRYDYSLVCYINQEVKVKIKCSKHGVFEQSPNGHLANKGCSKCGRESIEKSAKEKPTGWSITHWKLSAERSKNFDSFKVYIIKCWNDSETFYKIGRTFKTTNSRFRNKRFMPYNYEIVKEFIFDNAKDAFDKEADLKRLHKEFKYIPLKTFGGMHECFAKILTPWI